MTVDVTPWAIDGNTHSAADFRTMLCSQMGGTPGSFTTSTTIVDGAHGIEYAGDLKVTQNGTPNMTVQVAAGSAFIRSGEAASQAYHARNDAAVTGVTISAADAVNARKDLVLLQVRDQNFSGANKDARLVVVTGTPAASPADPSLASFPNSIVLARVDVPALDTAITDSQITDLRVGALGASWFMPRGLVTYVERTVQQGGVLAKVDLTGLTTTFTALANRRYQIVGDVPIKQINNAGVPTLFLIEGSTDIQSRFATLALNDWIPLRVERFRNPGAGSFTYKLALQSTASAAETAVGSALPGILYVVDAGGLVG